jgi:hypothetical protein
MLQRLDKLDEMVQNESRKMKDMNVRLCLDRSRIANNRNGEGLLGRAVILTKLPAINVSCCVTLFLRKIA